MSTDARHTTMGATNPASPLSGGTLWVHVATLLRWTRPAVGIVRVEQEYARWLLQQTHVDADMPVRFCAFDKSTRVFREVTPEAVRAALAPQAAASPQRPGDAAPASARGTTATLKVWIRRCIEWAVPLFPPSWVPHISRWVRASYEFSKGIFQARVAKALTGSVAPGIAFRRGDRFVSLGLDWDTLDQSVLYQLKRAHDLRITLVCYDTIPVTHPQLVTLPPGHFGSYLVELAWCADNVLCISHNTESDFQAFVRRMGLPQRQTRIIRLGCELPVTTDLQAPEQLSQRMAGDPADAQRPFVLFVSTIERRKNHEVLYRAWTRLREQIEAEGKGKGFVPHRLVFVGMPGWGTSELLQDIALDPRIQGDIVMLHHVSDAELAWLYQHCAFTVFPSLYEGWGLPVSESLAWGKFCLCSGAASLPEAGGDFCEYLDPWDLPAWVARLGHWMRHPHELQQRNQQIAQHYRPTAWAQTAQQIQDAVQGAVQNPVQSDNPAP